MVIWELGFGIADFETAGDEPSKKKNLTAETRRTQRKDGETLISNFGRRETFAGRREGMKTLYKVGNGQRTPEGRQASYSPTLLLTESLRRKAHYSLGHLITIY